MVRLCSDGLEGLLRRASNGRLICFGAGGHLKTITELYRFCNFSDDIEAICDNDASLWGSSKWIAGREIPVISMDQLRECCQDHSTVLLITCHLYSMEIVRQLDQDAAFHGINVYVGSFLSDKADGAKEKAVIRQEGSLRIPKTIHYCWFGGQRIPDVYREYMESWKRFCPDYEIRRWDEGNFDISQSAYMSQAYRHKKWAFVSDYARIRILYEYGGIYLDTDVELLRSWDEFLYSGFFCGMEDAHHVNLGLGCGAVKGHPVLKRMLDIYDGMCFEEKDGSLNLTPCVAYQTEAMRSFSFEMKNVLQVREEGSIYPTGFFAPLSPWGVYTPNVNTASIHHYTASWQSKDNQSRVQNMYRQYLERLSIQREEDKNV